MSSGMPDPRYGLGARTGCARRPLQPGYLSIVVAAIWEGRLEEIKPRTRHRQKS